MEQNHTYINYIDNYYLYHSKLNYSVHTNIFLRPMSPYSGVHANYEELHELYEKINRAYIKLNKVYPKIFKNNIQQSKDDNISKYGRPLKNK